MALMIDPPSGWRYGFPRLFDPDKDGNMRDFLVKNGYPETSVDFALQYIRCWEHNPEEDNGLQEP